MTIDTLDPVRVGKAYSTAEAARLAKTTPQTLRRWMLGYDAPGHHMDPVFGDSHHDGKTNLQVSFLELVEIAVAAHWRKLGIKLPRIRKAHEFARKELFVPFPFATMDFKTLGGHIIHRFEVGEPDPKAGMMAFDHAGQWTLPVEVETELEAVDYDPEGPIKVAYRWFPYGRDQHVIIDPRFSAGRPIIEGTRIPVVAIQQRFDAGDSIRFLARDYSLTVSVVEEVIRLAKTA